MDLNQVQESAGMHRFDRKYMIEQRGCVGVKKVILYFILCVYYLVAMTIVNKRVIDLKHQTL